jgi:hypothetical protein
MPPSHSPCSSGISRLSSERVNTLVSRPLRASRVGPSFEQCDAIRRSGERQIAALHPLDVRTEFALDARPDAIRLDHQRQLGRVAALLAHEAPVASGLRASDLVLFEKNRAHAALREVVRRRTANDAAAHNDDISLRRHRFRRRHASPCIAVGSRADHGNLHRKKRLAEVHRSILLHRARRKIRSLSQLKEQAIVSDDP